MDLNRLMSGAVDAHQNGRLVDARAAYDRILAGNPDQPDALHYRGMLRHQTGDTAGAAEDMARAVENRPRDMNFRFNLAEVLRELGKPADALGHYRKIIEAAPGDGDARFGLGNCLFDLGDFPDAVRNYQAAARAIPDDPEIHNNLANALVQAGEIAAAAESYRRATEIDPSYGDAAANLASTLDMLGQGAAAAAEWKRADEIFRGRIAADSGDVDAIVGLARACTGLKDDEEAMGALLEAEKLAPDDSEIKAMLGRANFRIQRHESAAAYFEQALSLTPANPDLEAEYAEALAETGRVGEAQALWTALRAEDPENLMALSGLGTAALRRGRFDEAAALFREALDVNPHFGQAWFSLAASKELTGADAERLDALLADDSIADANRQHMHFARADAADRAGDYDTAFRHYAAGNAIRRRESAFDPDKQRTQTDRAIRVFDKAFFKDRESFGTPSDLPVMIIGMPRSGTTLVEQIAASHPRAHGAGELYVLSELIRTIRADQGDGADYPELAADLSREDAAKYGEAHIGNLRRYDTRAARIVDKMPGNFVHLGLAALVAPGTQVIHSRRNAIDTCLSCYFQNFRSLDFSFDLMDIGHFYVNYRRFMDHWRDVLPIEMLELRYENVIADQESESRRLIDHLGLPWDDACLAHHKADRQIATASTWQARQPVYKTSVERWRRYEKHIGPLIDALGAYADEQPD